MSKRVLVVSGIAVLVIAAAVFATAQAGFRFNHFQGQGRSERRHGPSPEMVEHMAQILGLNEDQKTQIKALMEGVQAGEEARHQKIEELRKQLEATTANGQFDEAKVREIANQQGQIHAEQILEHERMKAKVFSLLTPEQRVKAEAMHKRGGGEYRRHGGPPREGGGEKN